MRTLGADHQTRGCSLKKILVRSPKKSGKYEKSEKKSEKKSKKSEKNPKNLKYP
jgi:hypothetical protein